jgi:Ca2+-binding RTX toxin-like protein
MNVVVFNSPPSFVAGGDVTVGEGFGLYSAPWARNVSDESPATCSFVVTPADPSLFTATGQPVMDAAGNLTFTLSPGAEGSTTVTATLFDSTGLSSEEATFQIAVANLAPVASLSGPAFSVPGLPASFTLTAADPGQVDQAAGFTFAVTWGDGTEPQTVTGLSGMTILHSFAKTGVFHPTVSATDKDGAPSFPSSSIVTVNTTLVQNGVLYVGGTPGRDVLSFTAASGNGLHVKAMLGNHNLGTFAPEKLVVFGSDGDDSITFASRKFGRTVVQPRVPARILGGAGNDVLNAAADKASVVLVGGAGNDQLVGSASRDLLIGGAGGDQLRGGGGDDILVAGETAYDTDLASLDQLLAAWGNSASYKARVNALFFPSSSGPKLNRVTTFNDSIVDSLFGESGTDWFIATTKGPAAKQDKLTKTAGETVVQQG